MEMRFCQSCGMPLSEEVLGTNADGSRNEDYNMYCYKDGHFLQECTMEEMIVHCSRFVDEVNKHLSFPLTREEYIGQLKISFPHLKRWRESLRINEKDERIIVSTVDALPVAYISSVDDEGFPCTKAMLAPRVREGVRVFYFTTNTFSVRVAQYKANPKASVYFCDEKEFRAVELRGTMEVLTDAASKEMVWRDGDNEYYPGGITDPNYCVLRFTTTDGRFYSDFSPRSFIF